MEYFKRKEDVKENVSGFGHGSWVLLDEANGCVNDCAAGVSYYKAVQYTPKAFHSYQEGFYVISGSGSAVVGDEEFSLTEGMSFIVPQNVPHQLRSDSTETALYVFWFHADSGRG